MNKTLKLVALGLLALIATVNVQAMNDANPSKWHVVKTLIRHKISSARDSIKASAASAKAQATAHASNALVKIIGWTPAPVQMAAEKTARFFRHPAVYYPLTAAIAAGLGYKSYSIYQDEFEFTKKAAAYAAGSAFAGYKFAKEPVMAIGKRIGLIK